VALPSDTRGRVFVTGLSGFTGRHLQSVLESAGYSVCDSEPGGRPDFDLTDPVTLDHIVKRTRPDFVIHLAGISFIAHGDAKDFYLVNTVGTTNLLQSLYRNCASLRRVILASSANVYGNASVELVAESTPAAPVNDYACSKLAMEFVARTWFDRLPIIITRPFNYTGPGQPHHFVVPKIVDHFARNAQRIELGNLDIVRDFSDVRAIVDVYCRLLDGATVGETYNVCSNQGHSLQWIIDCLTQISGHSPCIEVNPDFVRENDVTRLIGSNEKLVRAIGPLRFVNFSETLRAMYEARCGASLQAL